MILNVMEVEQTAIEYLIEELRDHLIGNVSDVKLHILVETSLSMEKKEKETEYRRGFQDGKQYYKKIMKTKDSATKITDDKITRFVERLKKIGIDVKLVGNFPWVYIDEICGKRVTEKFQANHGFTLIFFPGRNDSPPSEFTDISEIFKLIRKYTNEK